MGTTRLPLIDGPLLIDGFCGAGGAARGYYDRGFDVLGVDLHPQPRYPFPFIQADFLEFLKSLHVGSTGVWLGRQRVAAVHASPPCQARSDLRHRTGRTYPELIEPTQQLLDRLALPFVIENVEGAHELRDPVTLCGTMFPGLRVIRHRLFETNWNYTPPEHPDGPHPLVFTYDRRKRHGSGQLDQSTAFVQVTGGGNATVANKRAAMGIDWMIGRELNEAIPPAYTRHIGEQLMQVIT